MRRRKLILGVILAAVVSVLPAFASAAELVMYRRAGCPYCAAWDRSIGPIYPKTDIGRRAPIRLVDLDDDRGPKIALKSRILFTPTFVLADGGREIGRIEGYAGEDFFWGLLERLMLQLAPQR